MIMAFGFGLCLGMIIGFLCGVKAVNDGKKKN